MSTDLFDQYTSYYHDVLMPISAKLREYLNGQYRPNNHIDQISVRPKDPKKFVEKANSKDEQGVTRYEHPFRQIQDQIGARIVVFFKTDVVLISEITHRYYREIEDIEVRPDSQWKFGYFGRHYILALPREIIPRELEISKAPTFFELQIKTLFQHAWSEANHDLGYKPIHELSDDQQRRLAYTSAQAWGADRIFDELSEEFKPKK
jgi:putative GTP pyrophosphokinase